MHYSFNHRCHYRFRDLLHSKYRSSSTAKKQRKNYESQSSGTDPTGSPSNSETALSRSLHSASVGESTLSRESSDASFSEHHEDASAAHVRKVPRRGNPERLLHRAHSERLGQIAETNESSKQSPPDMKMFASDSPLPAPSSFMNSGQERAETSNDMNVEPIRFEEAFGNSTAHLQELPRDRNTLHFFQDFASSSILRQQQPRSPKSPRNACQQQQERYLNQEHRHQLSLGSLERSQHQDSLVSSASILPMFSSRRLSPTAATSSNTTLQALEPTEQLQQQHRRRMEPPMIRPTPSRLGTSSAFSGFASPRTTSTSQQLRWMSTTQQHTPVSHPETIQVPAGSSRQRMTMPLLHSNTNNNSPSSSSLTMSPPLPTSRGMMMNSAAPYMSNQQQQWQPPTASTSSSHGVARQGQILPAGTNSMPNHFPDVPWPEEWPFEDDEDKATMIAPPPVASATAPEEWDHFQQRRSDGQPDDKDPSSQP